MKINLSPDEARVLGVLIEKAITTPEQYPLSLNALCNGCNQKSNRDPVMNWEESEVRSIVDQLIKKRLVKEDGRYGRVVKFKHWFCNTEFGDLKLSEQELGIICVLFLRGPQTPGELRSRTSRLCEFVDVNGVESTLVEMMTREDGPFLMKLEREQGKRESRYAHLFCGDTVFEVEASSNTVSSLVKEDRISILERQVAELKDEMKEVKTQLSALFD